MKSNLDNKQLLEQAPVKRLFMKYAVPNVVTMLFFGLQNIVDGAIVGNYIGAAALGGVNIVLPFYSMVMVISLIIGIGSQTLVSLYIGKSDLKNSQDAMTTGFWALSITSLLVSLFSWVFMEDFTYKLGADEILKPYALGYLKGLLPFIYPITIAFYSDAMLKAMGHPRFAMLIMSCAVILNVVLNLYFVIVLKLGTMGAGMGTGLAFTVSLAISAFISFNPRQRISMLKGRFRSSMFWHACYNGSSEGVSEMASAITILIINLSVMDMIGAVGVSAFSAINYINLAGVLIFIGIADGLIPVFGYNYGAKNYYRVKAIFRYSAVINLIIGLGIFAVLQLFGGFIVGWFFGSADEHVFEIAVQGLSIYSFVFLANGLNIQITSFFTSLGDAKSSIIIATLRGMVFVIGGVAVLPLFMGIDGVWAAIPLAEFLTLGVAMVFIRRTRRLKLKF